VTCTNIDCCKLPGKHQLGQTVNYYAIRWIDGRLTDRKPPPCGVSTRTSPEMSVLP